MATVIGLGVQFSANANGMTKGLSQADRAIQNLARQASSAASLFDSFSRSSAAAATAQQQVATDISFLNSAFRTGQVSAEQYVSELATITDAAQTAAAAFAEGAKITQQVATVEEQRAQKLQRLEELLAAGAITQQTYARAAAEASGANAAAAAAAEASARATADAERARGQALAEGARVAASVATEQEKRQAELERLAGLLEQGAISEETYARAVAVASGEQAAAAEAEKQRLAVLAEGTRITQQFLTAEEKRAAEIDRLGQLLEAGAISQETYDRAIAEASGANAAAAKAEQERADAIARAAQITQANLSPQQKYDQVVGELNAHLQAGRISQETYNAALAKAQGDFDRAAKAAAKFDAASAAAGDGGVLKFNELSGVLSAIPGPIGNVAGRLSGLASAGEGLGRVFSGGLTQGLASVGTSVAGLINPFTAGLAAAAAFGAGAAAVAKGLVSLEDRVEALGNAADKLGVSFEFIQTIEAAATRSGTSLESVNGAMSRLQKVLAGADEESKQATAALAKLGISFSDLETLSPEEQITTIGERLRGIEDPAKRTAAAMALFGRSGAELLPFFANLGPAASDVERLGAALTEIDRRRIDDFGAGVDALGVATQGLGQQLLLPFVGLGEGIAQGAAEFIGGINAIVAPIGDVLEPALSALGSTFEVIGTIFGTVGRIIGEVLSPLGDIFQGLGQAFEPFRDGVASTVQQFGDAAVAVTEWVMGFTPVGLIADNIGAIGETISRVAAIISAAFTQSAEYIGNLVSSFAEFFGLQSAIESIGGVISSIFGGVSATFQTIANAIGGTVGRLLTIAENFLGIKQQVQTPIRAELDLSQPALAATQFANEIDAAATKAAEFGDAGFQAALAYQGALEQIAQLQADGTLTADEAKKAADQERQAFESKIDVLDREAEAQRKAAEEAQRAADEKIAAAERAADAAIEADRRRADSFMATQGLGGEDAATKASEDLLAITRQIEEAEAAIAAARAAGDASAEQAAVRRLQLLDQAQAAAEETIKFGFSTQDAKRAIDEVRADLDKTFTFDNFALAPEAFADAQEQLRQLELDLEAKVIDPATFEEAANAIRKGFEDALATAQKIADLNERYAERAAEIEASRLDALSQVSTNTLQANDVRTSEGAADFLRLATGREDPAIAEYRKQLGELQKIAREIRQLGGVVDIVGAN